MLFRSKEKFTDGCFVHEDPENPVKGFHLNTLASTLTTWREVVEKFILANAEVKKGNVELMKVWTNTEMGQTWEEDGESIEDDVLLERRETYDCEVPEDVMYITVGVDTQDDRFEIDVVGWGPEYESWGIKYAVLYGDNSSIENQVWKDLDTFLLQTFEKQDGTKLKIICTCSSKMVEKDVTILGILNDEYNLENDGLEGWFLMPEQAVLNWLSYDSLNAHLLVSADADKEETVQEALAEMLEKKSGLNLETYAGRKAVYEQTASQMFAAISGLAIFIMMFSILSMMNTLITNIVTRKQELAMLEAIGMSKVQIRKMLLGESLFLVFSAVGVTVTIGTLSGYVLSNMLYNMGAFYMAFRFPVKLALIYAGVLTAVPLLITFVSMHSFSKEALVERLRGMEN